MKRKFLWMGVSFLLVAALVLGSCAEADTGEQEEEEEEEEEEEVPRIGFISQLPAPWFLAAEAGFRVAAEDFGFEPVFFTPATYTVEPQIMAMEAWIAMEIDAIMIFPNDPDATIAVISEAIDAGIPVITFNVDSPGSERLLFLGYDPYDLGVAMTRGLLALLELAGVSPPGKVSFHIGDLVSSEAIGYNEAFHDTMEAAGYEAVEPLIDGGDAVVALSLAEITIELYPDLVGMMGYYDYIGPALGKAVTDAGKIDQIVVHANGIQGEQALFMETGAIKATTDLLQYDGSYLVGEILYKLIQAGPEGWDDVLKEYVPGYPADKVMQTNFGWITWEKVDIDSDKLGPMGPGVDIDWIMTVEEWKKAYPVVWDILR